MVQAVLVGRESLTRDWQPSIVKAFIPESGLGQVEGTAMPQGTRLRALWPGTERPVSPLLAQQASLSVPSPSERCGEETKRRPKRLACVLSPWPWLLVTRRHQASL